MVLFRIGNVRTKFRLIHKLLTGFGIVVVLVSGLFFLGNKTIRFTSDQLQKIIIQKVKPLAGINLLQSRAARIRQYEAELSGLDDYWAVTGTVDKLKEATKSFEKQLDAFLHFGGAPSSDKVKRLKRSWQLYRKELKRAMNYAADMNLDEVKRISRYASLPRYQIFSDLLAQLSAETEQKSDEELDDVLSHLRERRLFFLWTSVVGIGLIALFGYLFSRSLSSRILAMTKAAEELSGGRFDCRVRLRGNDEISDLAASFERMRLEIQKREQDLQVSEARYRSLFEDSPVALWEEDCSGIKSYLENLKKTGVHDFKKHFEENVREVDRCLGLIKLLDVNKASLELFEADDKAQLFTGLSRIHNEESLEAFKQQLIAMARGEKRFESDTAQQVFSGEKKIVHLQMSLAPGYEESWGKVIVSLLDLSQRKRAEEEKKQLEERLVQVQKMEALGNLAGGVAHDFNNLLQAMSGYAQLLLLKKNPGDADYKYLSEINRTTDRASDLVRRLLTFSRKMEIHFRRVSVNEIIVSAIRLLERTIPKMVAIEKRLDPNLKDIHADPTQIEQILLNLGSNAVDAMEGSGRLTIETENFNMDKNYKDKYLELRSGEYIRIQVSDTGKGIDEATRQRIFEPFFTTKEPGKGTGLGLATVYGIVKAHRGHITCYSESGAGTTFAVFLPVEQGDASQEKSEPSASLEIKGGTETILLVDDEDMVLSIAEELLSGYGYNILTAPSGEKALQVFADKSKAIDLVLMDLGMPGMGGERCLEELQKMDSHVKVIVASGYAAHKIARDPQAFGAADFLAKPYRLDVLANKVRTALDNRRGA